MPNTKSAERRVRSSERKRLHNRSIKARLKSLERAYEEAVKSGKKEDANAAYRKVSSAFDKAAKTGVIHKSKANRKKSRLNAYLTAAPAKAVAGLSSRHLRAAPQGRPFFYCASNGGDAWQRRHPCRREPFAYRPQR